MLLFSYRTSFLDVNFILNVDKFLQVAKIKIDDREDLKVLATGVAAALASRKVILECKSYYFVFLSYFLKFTTFHILYPEYLDF